MNNCSNWHSLLEAEFYNVYVVRHAYVATEAISELEPKRTPASGNQKRILKKVGRKKYVS